MQLKTCSLSTTQLSDFFVLMRFPPVRSQAWLDGLRAYLWKRTECPFVVSNRWRQSGSCRIPCCWPTAEVQKYDRPSFPTQSSCTTTMSSALSTTSEISFCSRPPGLPSSTGVCICSTRKTLSFRYPASKRWEVKITGKANDGCLDYFKVLTPEGDPCSKTLELYFNVDKLLRLKTNINNTNVIQVKSKLPSATSRYERIRVAGKGAFGMAVLYRRKDDESLVIIKEIRIHELSSNERQLALNEVTLLSQLDHPNIISYYDSFEEDGVLMIEMEFAEGGTLAQLLARIDSYIEEGEILRLFDQITNAVAYLHDNSVLHRDLKTANIFLTKYNDVKVGDFGISKIMSAETVVQGAQTVVGTPFYISPEMCEGKPYNEKSDIWALGCILYEMACLQKTFDGANLPAVVNKIMKAEYNQVKGPYSNKLKLLIRQMLKTDPKERPTAKELLEAMRKGRKVSICGSNDSDARFANSRSSLYHLDIVNMVLVPEPSLPPKIKVKQIEFSLTHTLLLSADNMVYSWGENKCGQLGLGDRRSRGSPTIIEVLSGKGISKIAAGNQFSVFCSTKGVVLVCGQQKYLGNGEKGEDCLKPKVVDSLLRVDITDVACGDEHTVAVDTEGRVYVWGSGKNGRLGTGDEQFVTTAIQITIPIGQTVMNVRCGHDCTTLLTTSGIMLAMGSNKYNKLNLNHRQGFFADMKDVTDDVDDVMTPRTVKPFASRIVDVKLGTYHSGVLLESGHIHLFGRNSVGELGMGHRQRYAPWNIYNPVKALLNKTCLLLACGDGFSLAATSDNKLFFWGSKSTEQNDIYVEDLENSYGSCDDKKSLVPTQLQTRRFNWAKSSQFESTDSPTTGSIMLQPTVVLRLDTTPDADGVRPLIRLFSLCCVGKSVIVVIDTVSPSKKIEQPIRKPERRRSAPASTSTDNTLVEPWIQEELAEAENWAYNRHTPNPVTEQKLLREIEELKKKLNNHESTCKNHAEEMNQLQAKIAHLNFVQQEMAIQSVPPPAYDSQTKQEPSNVKGSGVKIGTRICTLM
uniref:non-specific serine/threonine protein kinase n=1 Tax=Steinernema glaseri TaxID=37863 RepID=A0A1I8ADL0_9BILA